MAKRVALLMEPFFVPSNLFSLKSGVIIILVRVSGLCEDVDIFEGLDGVRYQMKVAKRPPKSLIEHICRSEGVKHSQLTSNCAAFVK